jgi:cell division protein DivIC
MSKAKRRRSVRNGRRAIRKYRRSMALIIGVLVLLAAGTFVSSLSLRAKNQEYARQEKELKSQIAEEEERTQEIQEYQEYIQSDDYVRETARDKLGLVDPGEILFEPAD